MRHPGSPVDIIVQTLRDGAKQVGPCNSSTARRFNLGVIRGASVIRPGSNLQDKNAARQVLREKMAWQAEADATLEARPSFPLVRGIIRRGCRVRRHSGSLAAISLECFCGTASQGGADLPLAAHASPQAELFRASWWGRGLHSLSNCRRFGGIVVHVSRLLAEDLLSFPPCLLGSTREMQIRNAPAHITAKGFHHSVDKQLRRLLKPG